MFKGHEGEYFHSELHIHDQCVFYLTDIFSKDHVKGNNFQVVLELESEEEITRQFEVLSRDGKVQFPLQETFWGA